MRDERQGPRQAEGQRPLREVGVGGMAEGGGAATVEVLYYTDPLCSWSWAFEPQWRRLRYEFGDQVRWRYLMGGLLADWQRFHDPLNAIDRPAQMGPHWFQTRHLSGMPIDELVWMQDPPASSYPACMAVKAAGRQGVAVEEAYLRRLREAVMLERRNIARREVLVALAAEVASRTPGGAGLALGAFEAALERAEVAEAFRDDLKEARYRDIGRFPTLILRHVAGRAVMIVGYRSYKVLREALAQVAPEGGPLRVARDARDYAAYWGSITAREVAEALGMGSDAATAALEAAVAEGALIKQGWVYRACG